MKLLLIINYFQLNNIMMVHFPHNFCATISTSFLFLFAILASGPIQPSMPAFVDVTTVQVVDADQANRVAQKIVDDATEMIRRKYQLGKGWKGDRELEAKGNGKVGPKEELGIKHQQHRQHSHHHQHHFPLRHSGNIGGDDNNIGLLLPAAIATHHKYPNEEKMEKAKARGKQLLEALGVKENSNDGNEAIEGESNGKTGREGAGTPMTMRSLFGKFTRRD